MLYPNNIKKSIHHDISYANRGMDLENLINDANNYYLINDKAVIYKKPTPVKISKVNYGKNKVEVKGLLNQKSTLDYVGLYKGKYLDFDAKSSLNKSSFPLSNIHEHQLKHIKRVLSHGGIAFLIIQINQKAYILKGETLIDFISNNDRKSIPNKFIEDNGYEISFKYNPVLNYLDVIDKIYFKEGV